MTLYFKDVQSRDEKWGIELGKRMSHRIRQIDYEESLVLLLKGLTKLKPGMTIFPDDQILIRLWDDEPMASWYLVTIGVNK